MLRACDVLGAGLALLFPVLLPLHSSAPSDSGVCILNLLIFLPLIPLKSMHRAECGVTLWQRQSFHASFPRGRGAPREACWLGGCGVGWGGELSFQAEPDMSPCSCLPWSTVMARGTLFVRRSQRSWGHRHHPRACPGLSWVGGGGRKGPSGSAT